MPFTPFHFGPGLLIKGAVPRRFSVAAFVATNVCIDVETAFHLLRHDWPPHRQAHSLLGGTVVGLAVAGAIALGRPLIKNVLRSTDALVSTETEPLPMVAGGVLGGWSHSLLDSVVHPDVTPLWPVATTNSLFGLVPPLTLEFLCALTALAGAVWIWSRLNDAR